MDPTISELIVGLTGCLGFFGGIIASVALVTRSPKAKAKAEIMRAQALAALEDKGGLMATVRSEELQLQNEEQSRRIQTLEEEVRFLRRLLPEGQEKPAASR